MRITRPYVLGALVAVAPLALLALLLASPEADDAWENHPAHFWLVLSTAGVCVGLGAAVGAAARRRRDSRTVLVALACITAAGFLGLHALATPGVLLGPNAGFELATPVGLAAAGLIAALSTLELQPAAAARVISHAPHMLASLLGAMGMWALISLTELPPLDKPVGPDQLDGWQISLAVAGTAGYLAAAGGYAALYRRRRAGFLVAIALAFALLAEAMAVITVARNWRLSWWEWHVLMLLAFALVAIAARREWHEERFSALYLEDTAAGSREISVLFGDLAGFTAYSERLLPGAVAAMLNAYFGHLIPVVQASGGQVDKLIGDALMVVYNLHGDQPDHAARAARTALALQSAAAALLAENPDWPRLRVGVNTGDAYAGLLGADTGHRTHGVVGDAVNLASRLEAQAAPGEVVIGAETARRLPATSVVIPLPALVVKGKAAEVEAYRLVDLQP
ncbi:MAG: adenylate cyclase [Gaiellales bacterium]|jgi:class 3 adenylate cyclase|nr:adenylate cyclase [Gaiellales bacterium]